MEPQAAAPLVSHMIVDARPSTVTEARLRARLKGASKNVAVGLCVFEVHLDGFVHHCCWAGGELPRSGPQQGGVMLTEIGNAAVEALSALPFYAGADHLVVQELILGATPLQDKVVACLRNNRGAPVAFVGDLAGELDGKMGPAFNLTGMPLEVKQCRAPGPLVTQ